MVVLALAGDSIQLVPDGTLVFHVLVVLIMVAILNRTLYRPINEVLAERERETEGRRREARDLQMRIEAGLTQYERKLRDARADGYRHLEQERANALRQREQRLGSLREDIRSLIAEQKSGIEKQTQESRRALDLESMRTAAEISWKILRSAQ
jgi:F-type H+-transporting ATPase subunit b